MEAFPDRPCFFDAGLYFSCQRCGACCTGEPGIVRLSMAEISAVNRFLGLAEEDLGAEYLDRRGQSWVVREHPDGRCFFYDAGCRIYPVRPLQCATFPFWLENMRSAYAWRRVARECPGVGRGAYYDRERIIAILTSSLA